MDQNYITVTLLVHLLQVVRYHSLVIDPESLPKELIPISWTCSTDTKSFLENSTCSSTSDAHGIISSDSRSKVQKSPHVWPLNGHQNMRNGKVLMAIMHSARPHYGVQVEYVVILLVIIKL